MSEVIHRVSRANPATESSQLLLSQEELWVLFEERRDGGDIQLIDMASPATTIRRPRWTAALATFLAVLALGAVGFFVDGIAGPQPTVTAVEDLALATTHDFYAALSDGDVRAAADLMRFQLLEDDPWIRPGLEFLAALPGAKKAQDCTTTPSGDRIHVSCSITFDGPLFVATDQDTKRGIMTVDESGLITSRPALGIRQPVDRAFVEYASAVAPEAFAEVCGTDAYEPGTVQTGTGYSWTGPCGALWASLAEDAAGWVDDGMPPLSDVKSAVETAEDFVAALGHGDAEAALSLMHSDIAETPMVAPLLRFVAALPGSKTLSGCTTLDGARGITAHCQIAFDGPVFQAMGQTTADGAFLIRDGLLAQAPDLGRRPDVDNAFVEYARQAEPEAFAAACSYDSYEPGTVRVDTDGYVFAGPCGELWARLSDDMALWVSRGRPPLDDDTGENLG